MESTTTSSAQGLISSSNFLHDNKPVPRTSQQTETPQQEALHAWLTKTHSQLRFLSQIEYSDSFTHLISSLDLDKELQPTASEKNSIEFLLAIDNFVAKEKNLPLCIQFFIEKILKNCRFLIEEYRETYAKLMPLEKNVNQSILTEDLKKLQVKLVDLNKEEKQLQKSLLLDLELTPLIELTHDLEKFKLENDRDFTHEIAMHEAKLKAHTQELDKINKQAATIEKELTFPIDQLEANLRIKQRKLLHLEVDLYTLKQIRLDRIKKELLAQLELENTRLSLISELEECNRIKILKTQIEHPKTKQEDLRTESKIKKDLTQNTQNLHVITEFFKDIIKLVSIKNNNIIKIFLEKIQSTLNLNIDKNALEAKLSETNNESTTLQEELVAFLQQNESELIKHLKELTEDKQAEITKLQIEKQNLEILNKKNILTSQISEVEKKIQNTKNDQHIFRIIKENNLLKSLIYLERLQKISDNTLHETDELQKQISEIEKQITELEGSEADKTDITKLDSEFNKEKIKSCAKIQILKKKKNKYNLALIEQFKNRKDEIETEKHYRDLIEKEINRICEIKNKEWQSKLAYNQSALRFNAIDIRRLSAKIEKYTSNTRLEKQRQSLSAQLNRTRYLLLQQTVKSSMKDNTQQEHIFFDSLKAQLIDLKNQVENPIWNKSGWGFFFKKIPDGIQKIREIFNVKQFDTSEPETNVESNNLTMLNIFSEIYSLIKSKNSSTQYLRSPTVKNFYQSLQESLTQVINQLLALNEPVVEMHDTTQPICSTSPY